MFAGKQLGGRAATEALEVKPLDAEDVDESIAYGAKARTEITCEPLLAQRSAGGNGAVVGPGVVVVKQANCFRFDGRAGRQPATLAVVQDQVCSDRRSAQLAQHCGGLTPVMAAVVSEVLQHLPERLGIRIAFGRAIVLDARQVLCCASRDEPQQLAFDLAPARTDASEIRKPIGGREARRRTAPPALQPKPFAIQDVDQSGAARREAPPPGAEAM